MTGRFAGRAEAWVVTTPGLEEITAAELKRLDVRVARVGRGGLSCAMTPAQVVNANLRLRTATRVQLRAARFRASGERDLARGLRAVDWSPYLDTGRSIHVNVSSTGSRLYHTGLIHEVAAKVLADAGHAVVTRDVDSAGVSNSDAASVSIRLAHDTVTVSIDSSGEPLFRRGARTATGEAPLRETVAAALVLWSGWDGKGVLRDPCCGAGTIAIEGAQWAMRVAPGARRAFAFEHWPSIDADLVAKLRRAAEADRRPGRGVRIEASDVDAVADDAPRSVLVVPDHDGVDLWIGRPAGRRLALENGGLAVCFRDSAP